MLVYLVNIGEGQAVTLCPSDIPEKMVSVSRLDQELVNRGIARTRSHAAALIKEERVSIDGATAHKAGAKVNNSSRIEVSGGTEYVSRAAYKLVGALEAFPDFPVAGKTFLDAGASTGGFTQVLLERGASSVIAADVGHDQLAPTLRQDDRVTNLEGLNLRYARLEDLGRTEPVDGIVADLSFISLTMVIPALAPMLADGGQMLLMVKPQFEVGREALPSTGVVINTGDQKDAVTRVVASALGENLEVRAIAASTLAGQDGNREFFLWTTKANGATAPKIEIEDAARKVVAASGIFDPA